MRRLGLAVFLGLSILISGALATAEESKKIKPAEPKVAIVIYDAQGKIDLAKSELSQIYLDVFQTNWFEVSIGEAVSEAAKKISLKLDDKVSTEDFRRLGQELGTQNIIPVKLRTDKGLMWVNFLPRAHATIDLETQIITTTSDNRFFSVESFTQSASATGGGIHQEFLCLTPAWPAAWLTGGRINQTQRAALRQAVERAYARFFAVQQAWGEIFHP